MRRRLLPVAAVFLIVALAAGACAPKEDEGVPTEPPTTAAAGLRVSLELLFRENVFLLALQTENALTGQTKAFEGATEALEENMLAIGDRFEKAYTVRAERAFLAAWRPYTELLGSYAGLVRRNPKLAKAPQVEKNLGKAAGAVATFAAELTPIIGPRIVLTRMRDLTSSLRAVTDAQVAGDYKKADATLRSAADRAGDLAAVFARGLADDLPTVYPGDPLGSSAAFRAALTARLVEDVYLACFTSENILTRESKPRDGAKSALDAAPAAFGKVIGGTYGAEAEKSFLPVWKRGVDLLLAYPGAAKDKAKREKVLQDLKQYATDAGAYLKGLNEKIDAPAVVKILGDHAAAMTAVFDAQVAGDFKKADLAMRAAAAQIEAFGAALATATVERFPARFRIPA